MELTKVSAQPWKSDSPIAEALRATFEDLAFEEPYPAEETAISTDRSIFIKVDVLDPPIGGTILALNLEVAWELYAAMSGALPDKTPEDEVVLDAMSELTNIFTGKVLKLVLPIGQQFKLSLPETIEPGGNLQVEKCVRFSVGLSMGTLDAFIIGAVMIDYLSTVKREEAQISAV